MKKMRGKKVEELNPHYKKATKSLLWAYRRLGDAEKYFKGEKDKAKSAIYDARHAVKDALHLLGIKEKDIESSAVKQ